MRNRTTALIIKFIFALIASWLIYGFIENNTFTWILIFAIEGTLLSFIIGDLLIYPALGNLITSILDAVMAVLNAYIFDSLTVNFNTTFLTNLIFFFVILIFEFFFHNYLRNTDDD